MLRLLAKATPVVVGVVLVAALWTLAAGTASANGCEDANVVLGGEINQNVVVPAGEKWCFGVVTVPPTLTTVNGNVTVQGTLLIGGVDRPATVDGYLVVESGGKLVVKDKVEGDIEASGTAEVELALQARVRGNVRHAGPGGEVDFKGGTKQNLQQPGAQLAGNLVMEGGAKLKASGPNPNNRVEGNIVCADLSKVVAGTATNWDGDLNADGTPNVDGAIGGHYECAQG